MSACAKNLKVSKNIMKTVENNNLLENLKYNDEKGHKSDILLLLSYVSNVHSCLNF